ncbi:glycoside hydrolase family 18 protein [Pseudoxanthomonas dokdonensis]|uniref:chitinase n=1 Tax=Pseudoxanthomonas dokdonensis TaxID=344882 RepID=A0A0R0D0F3_9GAMM|nr:glycoside hydrolase family 18 protein [Pseudoxanthomonas dokdonensis]KRG72106.1 hypothetical protein ABB29_01260 [Pseudoxanthomonas dokdonensis]
MRNPFSIDRGRLRGAWLAWLLMLTPLLASADDTAASGRYQVIGYVVDDAQLPDIDARKLDVINFAFAKVDAGHAVFLPGDTASASLATLVALKQANPQLRIVLSVGGWGAGNFSEAAATAEARQRFADSAADLIAAHALDGLDIDWEYPTLPGPGISHSPADRDNFSRLLQQIRQRLDALGRQYGRHYLLTIAAADGEAAQGLDIATITPLLDWINLMTYDFYGSLTATTGHHASLWPSATAPADGRSTAAAVEQYLAAGVPPDKLNVGAAFYGRLFTGVNDANNGLDQPYRTHAAFVSWRDIQSQYLDRNGFTRHWDARAQAVYLWNPQQRSFLTYEDPAALAAKTNFVKARGLGGVMFWQYQQDDGALLDALRAALSDPSSPPSRGQP